VALVRGRLTRSEHPSREDLDRVSVRWLGFLARSPPAIARRRRFIEASVSALASLRVVAVAGHQVQCGELLWGGVPR